MRGSDTGYLHKIDKLCSHWEKFDIVGIVDAKPDHFDAFPWHDKVYKPLCARIGNFIIPTSEQDHVLPNFSADVKGEAGSSLVLGRRCRFVGALGARAVHKAREVAYGDALDGKAYTLSACVVSGLLIIFAHWLS